MAYPLSSTSAPLSSLSLKLIPKPGLCNCIANHILAHQATLFPKHNVVINSPDPRFRSVKAKAAAKSNQNKKPNSVICGDCDGNGAVQCSQCQGVGVNSVDFFNGQFKAGDSCWLCGGKKHMLCGNCNGAGFIGGFMSTFDE
ncbi:Heat shock protein DnaJ, cysteine-rich domain containing protein [Parasponia andersonii]|uniref:Heat shock protein DnaJ, cysteine-rich domain containing protein n=1 Tax=Parasponia andersonii TaxID=3476 RepID=A0A2P5ADU3_PARAD|nr:Heat shock protein DnaJ, cysteine-rich domain containing protein [Parasponia andersonii]